MPGLAPARGATIFGDAIRVCTLDALGAPLWGASSCIQSSNLVKLSFKYEWQAGPDVTQTNAAGLVCNSFKGRDTVKRSTVTVSVCDEEPLLKNLLVGNTIFTGSPARTVTDGVTTSASPNVASATGAFTSADVGAAITGTGIPSSTTILTVTDSTHVVMSANATATGTAVSVTITGPSQVQGDQGPKVAAVPNPNGCSVEIWMKRIIGDTQVGWRHFAFPRLFLNDTDQDYGEAFGDMSFTGFGLENSNWGSGPLHDFLHDSTALKQSVFASALPTPLSDSYLTITSS